MCREKIKPERPGVQPVYYSEVLEVLTHVSAERTFACAGSRCSVFYTRAQWMWRGKLSVIRDVSSDSVGRTVFKTLLIAVLLLLMTRKTIFKPLIYDLGADRVNGNGRKELDVL
jgi:hypothetical protein